MMPEQVESFPKSIASFANYSRRLDQALATFQSHRKSILVVSQHNLKAAQAAFPGFGFKVTMGSCYLGGFIGEDFALQEEWLSEKTKTWEEAVGDLASIAPNFPQAAYSGLQKSLQQEWQFVIQRVTKGIGPKLKDIELTLSKNVLMTLFGDDYDEANPCHKISCLPVKWAGLVIPNPTSLAISNNDTSILCCLHILAAVQGVNTF
jgi:hypothetical protein